MRCRDCSPPPSDAVKVWEHHMGASHILAGIDLNHLPRHVPRSLAAEERAHWRDVFWLPEARDCTLVQGAIARRLRPGHVYGRFDEAGRNQVHVNVMIAELD